MIFLVGAQRSGTNWIQRIITSHPDVANVPNETNLFALGIEPLMERFHHSAIGSYRLASVYMDRAELIAALRRFCDSVFDPIRRSQQPADRLLERTPDHVRHLASMSEIYPDARFVHIIRDGRDVVRSLRSQSWGPRSIAEAAERWRTAIESARRAAPGISHYREIRYEHLLADPRTSTQELFDWLGLDTSEAVLEQATAESWLTFNVDPSDPRVAQGKWRSTFSERDLEVFDRTAGDLLTDLGYERGEATGRRRRGGPGAVRRILVTTRRWPTGRFARSRPVRRQRQEVVDRFLELISAHRFSDLPAVLRPLPRIAIVREGRRWEGTGRDAVERLEAALVADDAFRGRQVLGDAWPGSPSSVLLSYRSADGSHHDRAFVLYVQGNRIGRLAYYELPLHPEPS